MDERKGKPNLRQERFVNAFIGPAKGNATQAAKIAGYEGTDESVAVTGYRTLNNAKVRARVEDVFASEGITTHLLARELHGIITIDNRVFRDLGKDAKMTMADKVRAIELAMKGLGMMVDRSQVDTTSVHRIEVTSIEAIKPAQIIEGHVSKKENP